MPTGRWTVSEYANKINTHHCNDSYAAPIDQKEEKNRFLKFLLFYFQKFDSGVRVSYETLATMPKYIRNSPYFLFNMHKGKPTVPSFECVYISFKQLE